MTVSSTTSRVDYTGNGVTVVFSVPFPFIQDEYLTVLRINSVTFASTTLVLDSIGADGYTVIGAGQASGSITVVTAPSVNERLAIIREVPATQEADFVANDPFPAETFEDSLDKLTMIVQQNDEANDRGAFLQASLVGVSGELPIPVANNTIGWNDTLTGFKNYAPTELQEVAGQNIDWNPANTSTSSVTLPVGFGFTQDPTNQYFTQNGAAIHRFNDRIFIGGATEASGDFPQSANDWVSTFYNANGYAGYVAPGQLFVANNDSESSGIGIVGAAHTANFVAGGTTALGMYALAVNDNASLATNAWGLYVEGQHVSAATSSTYAAEFNVRTTSAGSAPNSYQQGAIIGLQLAAGCGVTAVGQFDCSAALQVVRNPVKWFVGINFLSDSLVDIGGGYGVAIALAQKQILRWYGSSSIITGQIFCDATTAAGAPTLALSEGRFLVNSNSGRRILGVEMNDTTAVNNLSISAAATGAAPTLSVEGNDANVDLALVTKGTGVVSFGTFTASGDAAVNGYITVKDSGGTVRKLATIA